MMTHREINDTIIALSTPQGSGAIGVVRLSGKKAIEMVNSFFSKDITTAKGYSLHFGLFEVEGERLDEVLLSIFRSPRSYTREDLVEISCHGSPYILRKVIRTLVKAGARPAEAGEFTRRAFLNGAMDLAQAEAVADLIASNSAAAHKVAFSQMRGGVSQALKALRQQLLNFTSLIELELDFGEEDVEFADRTELSALINTLMAENESLLKSFSLGNAYKKGVSTAILGKPNAGKSSLLNLLLQEDRAIVSPIPGTTRDVVEDTIVLGGVEFRLQDTAGLRETEDLIEAEGVGRSLRLGRIAQLVLYVFDLGQMSLAEAKTAVEALGLPPERNVFMIGNKVDLAQKNNTTDKEEGAYYISAKTGEGVEILKKAMVESVQKGAIGLEKDQVMLSNSRHYYALTKAQEALREVANGLEMELPEDLLTIDIRQALHHIGEVTGEITTDEVLGNIFANFCIGK